MSKPILPQPNTTRPAQIGVLLPACGIAQGAGVYWVPADHPENIGVAGINGAKGACTK